MTLSSGAGSLGVASTSNLGGAIETRSSDPLQTQAVDARQTFGSYYTTRSFLRFDTGDLAMAARPMFPTCIRTRGPGTSTVISAATRSMPNMFRTPGPES